MYTDAAGEERTHVAWHEVLWEIAALNGTTHTLVHAAYGDHVDLVAAGGDDGFVLVQWKEYEPSLRHFVLQTQTPAAAGGTLTVEGELTLLPDVWRVPLEQAVPVCGDILRTCDKGEPEGLVWFEIEQQPMS
ncbi:hypothetical protein ACI7RC_09180 [Brevibacillus sp. B_LB10_24]|uniref:hypothetical protein n=1 Tax=Brevibacillus sp. B_LB10_24 TaxID=3380645 RepID=UPI0038BD503B